MNKEKLLKIAGYIVATEALIIGSILIYHQVQKNSEIEPKFMSTLKSDGKNSATMKTNMKPKLKAKNTMFSNNKIVIRNELFKIEKSRVLNDAELAPEIKGEVLTFRQE